MHVEQNMFDWIRDYFNKEKGSLLNHIRQEIVKKVEECEKIATEVFETHCKAEYYVGRNVMKIKVRCNRFKLLYYRVQSHKRIVVEARIQELFPGVEVELSHLD